MKFALKDLSESVIVENFGSLENSVISELTGHFMHGENLRIKKYSHVIFSR